MYRCMQCRKKMSRNIFVCNACERGTRGTSYENHNTHTVLTQHCRVKDNGANYWDYVESHNAFADKDADEKIEHDQANPDYLSKKRLDELERFKNPPLNETRQKAIQLLNKYASNLTPLQLEAIRDFSKNIPQKQTAKRLGCIRQNVAKAYKSGIKKLKKLTEGKL